jgi:septal ring factor EnvC (AmiA/AmiB activator)
MTMILRTFLLFSFLIGVLYAPTFARAENSSKDLKEIEKKISSEQKKQEELKAKFSDMKKDVDGLKSTLIKTTSDVQKFEKSTGELEGKMTELQKKKMGILNSLNADREKLSGLITALERIRRTPTEALLAKPDAPLKTAQAAIILKTIVPELHKQAESLRVQLKELDGVETSLIENRQSLTLEAQKLAEEKAKMEALLDVRQKAMRDTESDYKDQQKAVAKLSQEAKDLRELIRKIEEKQRKAKEDAARKRAERKRKAAEAAKKNKAESKEQRKAREKQDKIEEDREERQLASLPAIGNGRLPLNGAIRTGYGQKDDIGATSKGIRIAGRAGNVVVAPLGGVIRYAGPFKKYGTIILLEHKNNYMSLIAGLGRIDTVEGQRVDAGEPLGKMGSGSNPVLYYELRYKGDPINPSSKLGL